MAVGAWRRTATGARYRWADGVKGPAIRRVAAYSVSSSGSSRRVEHPSEADAWAFQQWIGGVWRTELPCGRVVARPPGQLELFGAES